MTFQKVQKGASKNTESATISQLTSRPFAPIVKQTTSTPTPDEQAPQTHELLQRKTNLLAIPGLMAEPKRKRPQLIQAKLTIGQPEDKYEQEADNIAQQVVQRIHQPHTDKLQPESLPENDQLQMKSERSIHRESLPEQEDEFQVQPLNQLLGHDISQIPLPSPQAKLSISQYSASVGNYVIQRKAVIIRDKPKDLLEPNENYFASQKEFYFKEKMRLGAKLTLAETLKNYHYNWFNLKEDLAYRKPGETEERYINKLKDMEQLVKYRNALVEQILEKTVTIIEEKHRDLDDFNIEVLNFGSVTPTSDIDITFEIKDHPELEYEPVELFNQIFREKYGVTPGVMLDTNVYTSGFMPTKNSYKDKFKYETAEEKLFVNDAKVQKHRIQLALSFLSIRQYFGKTKKGKEQWFIFQGKTKTEFSNYLRNISKKNGLKKNLSELRLVIPALDDVQAIFEYTESLYQETQSEIEEQKSQQTLDNQVKNNRREDSKSVDLHLDTQAKDKLYVESLTKVSKILQELKQNSANIDDSEAVGQKTKRDLLRQQAELIVAFEKEQGKALIYANEAYFSGGAVYHVVKGMQGGGDVAIHRQQKMQSILMNIGYKLQHFKHKTEHGGLGRALIDTSKYGQRVSDLVLAQNTNSGEAEDALFNEISEDSLNILVNEIQLVTKYKKANISPNKEDIERPTGKEEVAAKDFPTMTKENIENAYLEIAHKTLGPYYWDKYKTKEQLWASKATGYHKP